MQVCLIQYNNYVCLPNKYEHSTHAQQLNYGRQRLNKDQGRRKLGSMGLLTPLQLEIKITLTKTCNWSQMWVFAIHKITRASWPMRLAPPQSEVHTFAYLCEKKYDRRTAFDLSQETFPHCDNPYYECPQIKIDARIQCFKSSNFVKMLL